MEVVIVLVIFALALAGITRPFMGLLALLAVSIIQPGEIYPNLAPFHVERVLAVFVTVSFFAHGNRLRFPTVTKWFLAFYGAMIVAIPFAWWRLNSIQQCIWFLEIVVLHLFAVSLLTNEQRVRRFIITSVALVGWLAATSLFLYFTGVRMFAMNVERAEGLTSSGGDPNTLGITLVVTLPLDLLLMSKGNPIWVRLTGLAVALMSVTTIIITGSRTSFFSLVACLFVLMIADWRRKLKFLPLLLVALPLIWLVLPQQYRDRYETVRELKEDESYQNRVLSWKGGIQMFLHNPITGVGPDNYTVANGDKYWPAKGVKHYLNAHSLYFKVLGELGLVGVFTFFGYVLYMIRLNHRLGKSLADQGLSAMVRNFPRACQVSLIMLLITGYSAHSLYRAQWFLYGAILGSIALLPSTSAQTAPADAKKRRPVGAWVPGEEIPAFETVPSLR